MKLDEWLTLNGKTQREFARSIRLTEPNLSRIINGLSLPSAKTLYLIEMETNGAVGVADFWSPIPIAAPSNA